MLFNLKGHQFAVLFSAIDGMIILFWQRMSILAEHLTCSSRRWVFVSSLVKHTECYIILLYVCKHEHEVFHHLYSISSVFIYCFPNFDESLATPTLWHQHLMTLMPHKFTNSIKTDFWAPLVNVPWQLRYGDANTVLCNWVHSSPQLP